MELILAIAALCQVSYGGVNSQMNNYEIRTLECQQYYITCHDQITSENRKDRNLMNDEAILFECIKRRNLR